MIGSALTEGADVFLSEPLAQKTRLHKMSRLQDVQPRLSLSGTHEEAPAEEPLGWPRIVGIDTAVAAGCLGGDLRLFVSILPRLFSEYGDLSVAPVLEPEEGDREALAARLHKLRGSAGLVGAIDVHRVATELEMVIRTPGSQALSGLQMLASLLAALRIAAEPMIATQASRWTSAQPHDDVSPLTASEREELLGLLHARNLEALDRLEVLRPALLVAMGEPAAEKFELALQALEFEQAFSVLDGATPI